MDSDKEMMRYYVYISDAKIDMLYPQIPKKFLKKYSKEFKFDIKIFSVTLKDNRE